MFSHLARISRATFPMSYSIALCCRLLDRRSGFWDGQECSSAGPFRCTCSTCWRFWSCCFCLRNECCPLAAAEVEDAFGSCIFLSTKITTGHLPVLDRRLYQHHHVPGAGGPRLERHPHRHLFCSFYCGLEFSSHGLLTFPSLYL